MFIMMMSRPNSNINAYAKSIRQPRMKRNIAKSSSPARRVFQISVCRRAAGDIGIVKRNDVAALSAPDGCVASRDALP